jgi:hypothetical protein
MEYLDHHKKLVPFVRSRAITMGRYGDRLKRLAFQQELLADASPLSVFTFLRDGDSELFWQICATSTDRCPSPPSFQHFCWAA